MAEREGGTDRQTLPNIDRVLHMLVHSPTAAQPQSGTGRSQEFLLGALWGFRVQALGPFLTAAPGRLAGSLTKSGAAGTCIALTGYVSTAIGCHMLCHSTGTIKIDLQRQRETQQELSSADLLSKWCGNSQGSTELKPAASAGSPTQAAAACTALPRLLARKWVGSEASMRFQYHR